MTDGLSHDVVVAVEGLSWFSLDCKESGFIHSFCKNIFENMWLFFLFCLAFVVPAPENVKYHRDSKSITCELQFPHLDDYCIRLLFNTSDNFQKNYSECNLQSNTEVRLDSVLAGTEPRSIGVSLCLKRRLDVCSDTRNAEIGEFFGTFYLHNFCA